MAYKAASQQANRIIREEYKTQKNQTKIQKQQDNQIQAYSKYECTGVKQELEQWREQVSLETIKQLEQHARQTDQYTATIIGSGGLLDYMAAIRAGLKIIWCSEIDDAMTKLQKYLFTATNHGDATKINYDTIHVPDVIKTGMPCPNYCKDLGSGMGSQGKTGYLYVEQAKWLIKLAKRGLKAAILEQTSSAMRINQGKDVQKFANQLSKVFYVHIVTLPVWIYGDVSNRRRLIITLINKQLGDMGSKCKFPKGNYNTKHYPIAADAALPDTDVTPEYITEQTPSQLYIWSEPKPGEIHKIGDFGE